MANKDEKIKVLAWGDYCCSTGFATVMSNIMMNLDATGKYDIDVLGINYSGDPYNEERFPGNVYPAMPGAMMPGTPYSDVFGRQRLLDMMGSGKYDLVFMVQDTFNLEPLIGEVRKTQQALQNTPGMKTFKTIFYFPIDAAPKREWASDVCMQVDFPVPYTRYAREEIAKFEPELATAPYIYHGTNLKDFYPIENKKLVEEFRKQYYQGLADDRFLIINVNRNQPRKDTARSLMVLKELKDRGHNPLLYMHMQHADIGGNIFVMADQLGLKNEEDFVCPSPKVFSANQGLPVETLNLLYNAADCVFTPTLGEGWGLSMTEGMATKTPIVAPNNTSLTEMLDKNRGVLVPCGNNPSMFVTKENDNERIRPVMDVELAADAIEEIMKGNLPDIEAAFKWAKSLSWKNICEQQWLPLFEEATEAAAMANKDFDKPTPINREQRRAMKKSKK